MIKTRKEKILEARIARLEKLISDYSKRSINESLPRTGMTLGQVLALYTGNNPNDFSQIIEDLEMTDVLYFIADAAGIAESDVDAYVEDLWDEPCRIKVNQGAGGGGSDDVTVIVDDISFGLDWMDEDEEEAYEARIARLEKLINEKTMGRNGEQSNAYKIWNFLMDNGPKTAEEIKAIFPPEKRATIAANLAGFPKKGVIIKQGGRFAANPDYEWDDVGKISDRIPSMADIKAAMDAGNIVPASDQLIGDLSIDDVINMVNDEFSASAAGSEASLVLDSQDADSFDCTIEFDEYDYMLKLHGEVDGDTLRITVPCTVYDEAEEEIGEVEWKGKTEFVAACTKVRTLHMIVGLCSAAIIKMMEQFDGLE